MQGWSVCEVICIKCRISASQYITIYHLTVILILKIAKPNFLHETPACNNKLPYQVWLQKIELLRKYHPYNIHTQMHTWM